ncbi:MAG: DNA recombination protein RmuC [Acidimicrobiales bacterium]
MNTFPLLASLAGGLAVGVVGALVLVRYLADRQDQVEQESQHAAVVAAVQAALVERSATAEAIGRDREATVQAAVERAAEVAESRLDARLRQGTERLDAGSQAFQKQASDIGSELRRMQKMITDLQERAAGQHGAVIEGLKQAATVTTQLQATAGGLREALASPKTRGQWGERMAEDVLRAAGFHEGINFEKQKALSTGGIPDITFSLPRGMALHMDVKFPIDNYVRHLEALEADDARADEFRNQFRRDAKAKVTDLAGRNYCEAADSVDYVLLFMPNESVYSFVHENDPGLVDTALAAKVVLCGPSTLFAVLAVVRQSMDNFMLERRGEEIMQCLSDFSAEWEKFSGHVDKLGKQIGTAQRTFDELDGARSNQMQRKLRKIDEIQARRGTDVADEPEVLRLRSVENLEPADVDLDGSPSAGVLAG